MRRVVVADAAEEAFRVVWWFRTDPSDVRAREALQKLEDECPGLFAGLSRDDKVTMLRWEGRLATLRWVLGDLSEPWDGDGAFDS